MDDRPVMTIAEFINQHMECKRFIPLKDDPKAEVMPEFNLLRLKCACGLEWRGEYNCLGIVLKSR